MYGPAAAVLVTLRSARRPTGTVEVYELLLEVGSSGDGGSDGCSCVVGGTEVLPLDGVGEVGPGDVRARRGGLGHLEVGPADHRHHGGVRVVAGGRVGGLGGGDRAGVGQGPTVGVAGCDVDGEG